MQIIQQSNILCAKKTLKIPRTKQESAAKCYVRTLKLIITNLSAFHYSLLLPIQKPSNYPMSANQMPSSKQWPTPCQIIMTPGMLILSNNLIHLLYATTYLLTLVMHLHLAQHPLLVFWGAIPGPMSIQQNHPQFTHFNLPSHCPEATRACDYSRCNLRRHWKIHEFRTEIDKFPTNHLSFPKDYAYLGRSNLGLIQRNPVSFGVSSLSSPSIIKFHHPFLVPLLFCE